MDKENAICSKETLSRNLLELIAISGEFPQKDLHRIAGGKSYKESVVGTLKREGLIKTYYRDSLRGLRLTCRAKKLLVQNSPERFKTLLAGKTDTNHIKSDLPRRERLHRIAGATVTMLNAGIAVFKDEKPDIFSPAPYGNMLTEPIAPAFYNSREIKEIGTVFVKIKGARSVGVLVTPRDILVVYNIGNALMKWDYRSEMRTKALMKTILCRERLPCYSGEDIKGLILADSMELCADILAETGGKQHFLLDGNYDSFYYLTNDYKGERILSVLCNAALDNRLRAILMSDLKERDSGQIIENDASEQDGTPVLFGFYCDLPRIKRFDTALSLREKRGVIICFDFQRPALEKYCCEYITFKTIDFNKWEMSFFEE